MSTMWGTGGTRRRASRLAVAAWRRVLQQGCVSQCRPPARMAAKRLSPCLPEVWWAEGASKHRMEQARQWR